MTKDKLTQKIFEKIEEGKITPKPRWQFLLRNYVVWTIGILSVLIGGVAVSVIIFSLVFGEWEVSGRASGGVFQHAIAVIPYVWIIFLGLFVFVANYHFKHTKTGYRYRLVTIVSVSIFVSIIFGTGLYLMGIAGCIDKEAGRFVPLYRNVAERRVAMWSQPEKGLLAGNNIVMIGGESRDFTMMDFNKKKWHIKGHRLDLVHKIILEESDTVHIIGLLIEDEVFEACALAPWRAGLSDKETVDRILQKIQEQGMEIPPYMILPQEKKGLRLRDGSVAERNIFQLRNITCESGTTTSQTSLDEVL